MEKDSEPVRDRRLKVSQLRTSTRNEQNEKLFHDGSQELLLNN